MVEYDIGTHLAFDWRIVSYIFLGRLSGGLHFFSVGARYWKTEFKPFTRTSSVLTPLFVAAGMLFLFLELGHPLRAWRLFTTFHPSSAISWGVGFLNIFFILTAAFAYLLIKGKERTARVVGYAGLPFAFLVSTYTGVLLGQATGSVLYQTAILPWMFLVGGLISGLAVVMLVSLGRQPGELVRRLGKVVAWLVVLELGMVFSEVIILLNGGFEEVRTAREILLGDFSLLFWVFEITIGAAVPLILLWGDVMPVAGRYVASVFLLVGVFTMRFIVVIGGQII